MAWWDSVGYDALRHHVATELHVPEAAGAALAQLRGQVAQRLLEANDNGDATTLQRAEKLFTFFDRVLFFKPGRTRGGRKAGQNSGGRAAIFARRLRLAETGDWGALWREAHAAAGAAPRRTRRADPPGKDAKAVEALVGEGLISKAMARGFRPATLATGEGVQTGLQTLFPPGAAPPGAADLQLPDADTSDDLVAAVKRHLGRSPRQSGPGPNGARFEHWRTLLKDSPALDAVAKVTVLFLYGLLSPEAMRANLSTRLVAFRKRNGGLRPIACGSVLRRLAAKAACEVFQEDIKAACGPHQYAVGKSGGCEVMHACI